MDLTLGLVVCIWWEIPTDVDTEWKSTAPPVLGAGSLAEPGGGKSRL